MPLHAGGIGFFEFGENGAAALVDVEGVGVGELLNADADGIAALVSAAGEFQAGVVVFGADLGAAYVFEQDDSAAVAGLFLRTMLSNCLGSVRRPTTRTAI